MYDDDTQLNDSSSLADVDSAQERLTNCIKDVPSGVSYRIKFKLCCLIHAIRYDRSPKYLTDIVQSVNTT